MARYTWQKNEFPLTGKVVYYADRPDGTTQDVSVFADGSMEILVTAPDGESEFLYEPIEGTTVNEAIARAEEVVLPDEDTGA